METGSGVYLRELSAAMAALGHPQAVLAGVYAQDNVALPPGTAFFPVYFQSPALPFSMPGMSDEMPYPSTRYRDMTPAMLESYREVFLARLQEAVESFNPDLILCHHLYLLCALAREAFPTRRIAGLCHGSDLRQLAKNPLCRTFIREQVSRLDAIFCLHEAQKEAICALFAAEPARVHIAGSGYNAGIFRRMPEEKPAYGPLRIAFAGKISEKKGVCSLLRALHRVPPPPEGLQISLAGGYDNPDYPAIAALIEDSPYPVELLGKLPQTELARLFNRCELFVLPSFYEGLPLVLLEALACGAKALCTDLPGIRPWLDARLPGHGVFFVSPPPMRESDVPEPAALPAFEAALAARICEALRAPAAAVPVSSCSWEGVASALLSHCESV